MNVKSVSVTFLYDPKTTVWYMAELVATTLTN